MDFSAISWLGVVLAAVAFFIVGGLWYGVLFGKLWLRLSGIPVDQPPPAGLPLVFAVTAVLGLVSSIGIAAVAGADVSAAGGLGIGLGLGFLIAVPVLVIQGLYERKPAGLIALSTGYNAIGFAVMGLIIGGLQ